MTSRTPWIRPLVALFLVTAFHQTAVQAQFNRSGAVGGVIVDAEGSLRTLSVADRTKAAEVFRQSVDGAEAGLGEAVQIRRISLKGLEAACRDFVTTHPGQILPDELRYLGGLLRIKYVLADPEHNDLIIAGPAEGWKVTRDGHVVGGTSGLPVLHLDDLLTVLRNVDQAVQERITCSIDPTEQGHRRLAALLARQRSQRGRLDARNLSAAVKRAYGPQMVRVTGVPHTSHFAQVLVAADYQMKRIAMDLEEAPIAGLPSYVALLKRSAGRATGTQPRWWLAPDFGPVVRSEDGLAFAIERSGVQVMTENEFLAEDGTFQQTGRKSPAAEAFASAVTRRYDELAKASPVFGELRNLMEVATVAAIIERYELLEKSGVSLPLLLGEDARLATSVWNAPKTVAAECTIMRVRRGLLVTASGGVEIDSWELAKAETVSEALERTRGRYLMGAAASWWSN